MSFKRHSFAAGLFGGVLLIWGAAMLFVLRAATLPMEAAGKMVAVFNPGISRDEANAAVLRAGGRPVSETSLTFVWLVFGDDPGFAGRLQEEGAIGAYRELPFSPTIMGCVAVADRRFEEATGL